MVCSHSVKLVEPTPCGQHVIVVPSGPQIDPQMWHIMSNALVTTFKGTVLFSMLANCKRRFIQSAEFFKHFAS